MLTSARTLARCVNLGVDLAAVLPEGTKVAAVGPGDRAAAREAGLPVDLLPTSGSGGADRRIVPRRTGTGAGARSRRPGLDAGLTARGFHVDRVAAHRTDPVESLDEEVRLGRPDGFDACSW